MKKTVVFAAAFLLFATMAMASEKDLKPQVIDANGDDGVTCKILLLVDKKGQPVVWKGIDCDWSHKKAAPKKQ